MKFFKNFLFVDLQLFADGAAATGGVAGADGATGATAADAGQQSGEPANAGTAAAGQEQTDSKPSFEELIKGEFKDQYNASVENIVKNRLKDSTQRLQRYEAAQPIFDILAEKYGVDPTDLAALTKATQEDTSFYREEALATGKDEKEIAETRRIKRENASFRRQLQEIQQQQAQQRTHEQADQQVKAWHQQAEQTKQLYPGFNMDTELKNETFKRLLTSGIDVRKAYEVVHMDEIQRGAMQFAAQKAAKSVADSVIAGANRPAENGTAAQGAVTTKVDVSKLTDEQIMDYRRRARKGEKITFT